MKRIQTGALVALLLGVAPEARAAGFLVISTGAAGFGTLSEAIENANETPEADTITFAIAGPGPHVITGPFPDITAPLEIDGYSEGLSVRNTIAAGSTNADLRIHLSGAGLPVGSTILDIQAGPTAIRGVAITGIPGKGNGIVVAAGVTEATIDGCFLGVEPDGVTVNSNGTGITVSGSAVIGGGAHPSRNLISGNAAAGVSLRGPDSYVDSNLIGTDRDGQPVLGNNIGIAVSTASSNDNRIGSFGPGNRIAGNDGPGIRLDPTAGTGNGILVNRIHDNFGLGIDLGGDGVTPNDADDSDTGPNNLINYPEITFARINGNELTVEGFIRGATGVQQLLFYRSDETDPSGFGEGEFFIGSANVSIQVDSDFKRFRSTFTLGFVPTAPFFVTATARRPVLGSEDSSEFSRAVEAPLGGAELVVTNTNDSGAGSLRAAVQAANFDIDPTTIVFDIPGDGPHEIALQSSIVLDGGEAILDGFTQPGSEANTLAEGSNADLRIVLDGSAVPGPGPVLEVSGYPVIVRGLVVHSGPSEGIRVFDCPEARVEGCFVGTDAAGSEDLGNAGNGIEIEDATDTTVGGPSPGQRNVISGNSIHGVFNAGADTRIVGNFIGTDAAGSGDLGNGGDGVNSPSGAAVIGSDELGRGNRIRANGGDGIEVGDDAVLVRILGNDIGVNDGLGIELMESGAVAGVTPNDVDDLDPNGANLLQNFPVIETVTVKPETLLVSGTLDVAPGDFGSAFSIRLYRSDTCDPSGHGEGEMYLGKGGAEFDVTESWEVELPVALEPGGHLTATVTREGSGNTSEFSECFALPEAPPLCGDANLNDELSAGDALLALRAAVGTAMCEACLCDTNDSGTVTSSDALLILRASVGQPVLLACPDCS